MNAETKEHLLDDSEFDIPVYSPVCSLCSHLRSLSQRHCDAFSQPPGIPLEIWKGQNPHKTPYPGDGGIRFESVRS